MNKDQIQGHWNEAKGKIKQTWGNLTDNDVTKLTGKRDEIEGLLQQKYGYEKEKAKKEVDNFIRVNGWDKDE